MVDTPSGASGRPDPISPTLTKLAALSGAGFALFFFLAFLFGGSEIPDFDDPVTEWTKYATENEDDMRISALFIGFALYELIWFAGYARTEFGRAEEGARGFARISNVVFAGALVGGAGLAIAIAQSAGALQHPEDTPPQIIRSLVSAVEGAWLLASAGFAAHMIAGGILILRLRHLPQWLGWVGVIGGACFLLQLLVLLSEGDESFFEFAYPVAFLTALVWFIATSFLFFKALSGRATPTAPAPTATTPTTPTPPPAA